MIKVQTQKKRVQTLASIEIIKETTEVLQVKNGIM